MIHLFVEFGDHHRFDDGQQFSCCGRWHAKRITECQCCRHVPTDHRTGQDTQLAAEATDQVKDLPAFKSGGSVQPRRAVLAGLRAGLAVAIAPAEGPVGKGAETFFSCSNSRPLDT